MSDARRFNYFDDWKDEILECPSCHWTGTFDQGSVEHYLEQMDSACPKCDVSRSSILAIILYPTLAELRANIDKPGIREWVERIDRGFDEFEAQKLREPSQLPDIGESSFTLAWDFDNGDSDDPRTVVKHGDVLVFSEPARYECYKRFGEVAGILKAKYGERITDCVPTLRSEDWLYGSAREAKNFVEWFRLDCFGVSIEKQAAMRSESESVLRNLRWLEKAMEVTSQNDSQSQLPLNFDAHSGPSHEQESRDDSVTQSARRSVPGVPGATWKKTEYGTSLVLEPNSEFDSLPSEKQTEIIGRLLGCMEQPNHIQRVSALRDEFADAFPDKTQRKSGD